MTALEPVEHNSQMQHGGPDPDDTPSNPTANPSFSDMVDARISRRAVLGGGLAAAATFLMGRPAMAAPGGNGRGNGPKNANSSDLLGFGSIPGDTTDVISIPAGYSASTFLAWGTPLLAPFPAWEPDASNSAADQERQVGMGHDGMHYFPIDGSSTHGLLVFNQEYTIDAQLFPDGTANWDAAKTAKSQAAHGVTIAEVEQVAPGQWEVVAGSPLNRRITTTTPMGVSGPAAGHPLLQTSYDPSGTALVGTANNCSMGVTPWGTYVTAEENANGYFHRNGDETPAQAELLGRYGYSTTGFGYFWATTDARFNTGQEPNEPNRFHWLVEVDPMDPDSTPVKRTALGRFKHESAEIVTARDNRVVVYSGDDERGDYIYKFVGNRPYQSYRGRSKGSPLDDGVLHVAVFAEDGTGHWEPLTLDNPDLAAAFDDMGELLVKTRLAADIVGATRMDRPEWISTDPRTKDVYCTLTNNSARGNAYPTDAANPIVGNPDGHIIRWREAGADHGATTFEWDIFLIAGVDPYDPDGVQDIPAVGFGSPDGLWFDPDGRLWIQTDGGQPIDSNDQMLAADPHTGDLRRFLVGVRECEVTGVVTTPDQRTMFVNIQHPGDGGSSDWPDKVGGLPRPATVVITKDDGGVIGT